MILRLVQLAATRMLATIGVLCVTGTPAMAQNNPGGNMQDNSGLNGSLSHADLEN